MAITAPLKLYTARICPYAQRSTIALAELGLLKSLDSLSENAKNLEVVDIDLRNKPEWYAKEVNQRGKVPALQIGEGDNKKILIESALITQYLLEEFGAGSGLIPSSPLERYNASLLADVVATSGSAYGVLLAQSDEDLQKAKDKLQQGIREINDLLLQLSSKGPFALGEKFTVADILTGPFIMRLPVIERLKGFKVPDTPEFARFHQWSNALKQHPSIQLTTASLDSLVEAYKAMAASRKK
ncbi:hypothetical protein RI367_000447 [Sorochytrium milnesiophthora]